MGYSAELQTQWDAFLKLLQVREPRFFEHMRAARPKEVSKYNLVVMAKTPDDLREIEVGLRVYQDKLEEFTATIFGSSKGIKAELASDEEWDASACPVLKAGSAPAAGPAPTGDQHELLKILEASIRQKVEAELRAVIQSEMQSGAQQGQLVQKVKEDLEMEEQNRRLAVRMTLIAEGDRSLSQLVMAWQQAKQTGDGGPPWAEVKQRILELLDATVQLIQS
jgi:hypothetical protein